MRSGVSPPEYTFPADTITDAGDITFECPEILKGKGTISWHIEYTQLSGTSAATIYREQSNATAGSNWEDIVTISAIADTVFSGQFYGARERLNFDGSGTQSTKVEVFLVVQYE